MPFPWQLLTAVGPGMIGGAVNAFNQSQQNRNSMQFSREMYELQKRDNLNFWNMQNEYNSPQAQMKRFQEAGLNPNLIYAQGNAGNAGSISTPDIQSPQFRSPEWGNAIPDGVSLINTFADLEIKQAQADNLKAQNSVIVQDALLRAAQIAESQKRTERLGFDLGLDSELRSISADARRVALHQAQLNLRVTENRDAREALSVSSNLREAGERILNMIENRKTLQINRVKTRAEIDNLRQNLRILIQNGVLNDLDIELKQAGFSWNDPVAFRLGTRILGNIIDYNGPSDGSILQDIRKRFWDWLK